MSVAQREIHLLSMHEPALATHVAFDRGQVLRFRAALIDMAFTICITPMRTRP